jgi:catechol 2,3-dioxygenase-like lactoylglutathione lyase family enzyme
MPQLTGLLEVALDVTELSRSREFYERVFGFQPMVADARFCAYPVDNRQVLLLFEQGGSLSATKFKALAGIDEAVQTAGHVVLKISADGKQLFSAPVAGTAAAVQLDLDVAGARKLQILVDYGEELDTGDYLNLVDARIVK